MDSRSQSRERALTLLYEAETKDVPPVDVLEAQIDPADDLTRLIVEGVSSSRPDLDDVIGRHAVGWSVDRMPALDRLVLRMATFELKERTDVPLAVIIDEAVELAKRFNTDDSGRFVNGVLSSVAREFGR